MKYIFNNPVKAGICKNANEYSYSNYREITASDEEDQSFLDVDEDIINCNQIIGEFLKLKRINIVDLKKDHAKLMELISILHNKYKISLRKIAEETNISREKIRLIFNEFKNGQ